VDYGQNGEEENAQTDAWTSLSGSSKLMRVDAVFLITFNAFVHIGPKSNSRWFRRHLRLAASRGARSALARLLQPGRRRAPAGPQSRGPAESFDPSEVGGNTNQEKARKGNGTRARSVSSPIILSPCIERGCQCSRIRGCGWGRSRIRALLETMNSFVLDQSPIAGQPTAAHE